MARGLRTARSYTLGIGVPQLENPVFPEIIRGVVKAARELGYSVLITHHDDADSEAAGYEHLARVNRVDGLLVATLEDDTSLVRSLSRSLLPFVVLNRKLKSVENHITFDSFAAARLATDYLVSLGHRRIAHLGGRLHGFNSNRRLAGYRAALKAAGVEFDPALMVNAGYTADGGAHAMAELLQRRTGATAIVAATTVAAAGALKVLHAVGVRVPEQVSIVGIHDVALAEMVYPPLTTVRLPLEEMGERGARGLIGLVRGECERVVATLSPQKLIVRESTAPPSATASRPKRSVR
jgi:LacI family transcriptional regulator